MDTFSARDAQAASLDRLVPVLREIVDLKRIHVAGQRGSLMEHLFAQAWAQVAAGFAPSTSALQTTVDVLIATRLGGLDAATLKAHNLPEADVRDLRRRTLHDVGDALDDALLERLDETLTSDTPKEDPIGGSAVKAAPGFVRRLNDQPRAGATYPGQPRLVLTPTESHGDHSGAVAIFAVLVAPVFEAEAGTVFLAGLAHHLHNATLPDAGHAGDVLLGEHRDPLIQEARARALGDLHRPVRQTTEEALDHTRHLDTPEAKAFHAADVLDRVLEMEWHARTARFTLGTALDDYNIVHEGFTQSFHEQVLRDADLL